MGVFLQPRSTNSDFLCNKLGCKLKLKVCIVRLKYLLLIVCWIKLWDVDRGGKSQNCVMLPLFFKIIYVSETTTKNWFVRRISEKVRIARYKLWFIKLTCNCENKRFRNDQLSFPQFPIRFYLGCKKQKNACSQFVYLKEWQ